MKYEIRREAFEVSPYRLVQGLCRDPVQPGQIVVQDHPFAADGENDLFESQSDSRNTGIILRHPALLGPLSANVGTGTRLGSPVQPTTRL